MQKCIIVGDCGTHGDVGSSLAQHSNCDLFANYVSPTVMPFCQVEASLVNIDIFMWDLIGPLTEVAVFCSSLEEQNTVTYQRHFAVGEATCWFL